MLKICVISDLHGNLIDIQPCELLLICGDIIPLKIQRNIPQSIKWFKEEFIPWTESLPCEEVVFIAGNHDFFLQSSALEVVNLIENTKITYLENSYYNYLSKDAKLYKIYGTPDCHQFGNWAFMYSDEYLKDSYSRIPENCDIIITHDAPKLNNLGLVPPNIYHSDFIDAGNEILAEAVLSKHPNFIFNGHIHEGNHNLTDIDGIKMANVSILHDNYQIFYEPLYLEI